MEVSDSKYCEELWKEYKPLIYRTVRLMLECDSGETEDIVSTVYLVLCEVVNTGVRFDNPKAWLFKVVHNVMCKRMEKVKHERLARAALTDRELKIYFSKNPHEEILISKVEQNEAEIIKSVMSVLKVKEKKIYKLLFEEGLTQKEAGEILGMSESAIKQAKYRITKKIKEKVSEELSSF